MGKRWDGPQAVPPVHFIASITSFGQCRLIQSNDQSDPRSPSGFPLAHVLTAGIDPVDHLIAIGKVGAGLHSDSGLHYRGKSSRDFSEFQTHICDYLALHQLDSR